MATGASWQSAMPTRREITLRALRIQVTQKSLSSRMQREQNSQLLPMISSCSEELSHSLDPAHLESESHGVPQLTNHIFRLACSSVRGLHRSYTAQCCRSTFTLLVKYRDLLQVSRSNSWTHKPRTGKGETGLLLLSICDFNRLYF